LVHDDPQYSDMHYIDCQPRRANPSH
jgi:hypothetical protein